MPGHTWLDPSCAPLLRVPFTTPSSPMAVRGVRQDLPQVDSDNLQLEEPIDDGGSRSQVWSASLFEPETGLRHAVAVKRFPPAQTAQDLLAIHREIGVMVLASQRSHRAARTWGWCQDREGLLCAVMKRYSQSLHSVIRRTKGQGIGLHATQRYGTQIATGVAELHAQNVVLSDLKPANVLIDEFDNCALSDFGISTLIMGRDSDVDGIHGTFQYMSPEAFEGSTVTTRADAWSFACTIIEMASGKPPWQGTSMSAICFKVTASRETPAIPACLPGGVRALLARCFAFEAAARPCFDEIVAVFAGDWGLDTTGVSPGGASPGTPAGASAGASEAERMELAALRAERGQWQAERREGAAQRAEDAQLVMRLQAAVVEHQDVNEQLQGKLVLILDTIKTQQQAHQQGQQQGGGGQGRAGPSVAEMQLDDCQEALQQVMRQKNTAKEMLKQEAARTRELGAEVEQLRLVTRALRAAATDRDHTIQLQAGRLAALRPPSLAMAGAHAAAPQPHSLGAHEEGLSWGEEDSETSEDSVGPLLADPWGAADSCKVTHEARETYQQAQERVLSDRGLSQATTPSVSAQVSWEMRGSRGSVGKGEVAPPSAMLRGGLLPAPPQLPRDYSHSNC